MKTVVITGATSGIGLAVAREMAAQGMRVIGVGRSADNIDRAKAALADAAQGAHVDFVYGDLSEQRDVHAVADAIIPRLDGGGLWALVNNAGGVRNGYTTTAEGYELQFALNHLAGFLLTHRLWPCLKKAGGRVILTGSNSHKNTRMHWSDVMYQQRYNCLMAYKQSKLAGMLFAAELNRRQGDVKAYVVDPGLVNTGIGSKQTAGVVSAFWEMRRRFGACPDVTARTYAYLLTQQPAPEGLYYHDCRACRYNRRADNKRDAARLFELSEQLCGVRFGKADGT